MAASRRRRSPAVIDLLREAPQRFDFHQAVRVLEAAAPGCPPVGTGTHPEREAVRFRGSVASAFPASDIAGLAPLDDGGGPPVMTVNFMSLAGAFGPLPPPLTELVQSRLREGDDGPRDFLDLFNHRLISLMARIRRAHQPALQPGRPEDGGIAAMLFALLGLRTGGLRRGGGRAAQERLGGLDRALPYLAGLLNQRPVSLHAVERLLASHFALPVRGTPLVGRWLALEPDQTTRLGRDGRNLGLGQGAVLGRRVWDQTAAIRLDIEPGTLPRLREFLPGGEAHRALRLLGGLALGDSVEVELRLILPAAEVPPARLSRQPGEDAPRLGWTAWLTTRPRRRPGTVTLDLCTLIA